MISDIQLSDAGGQPVALPAPAASLPPVADVKAYLAARTAAQPRWEDERNLFDRLPVLLRHEVRQRQAACEYVRRLATGRPPLKVQAACLKALAIYPQFRPLKTFRAGYDRWAKTGDWLVLVNRAKAGADWQETSRGLSDAFLDYVAARMASYRRHDAGEQAIQSILRQWRTGRTHKGVLEAIPGACPDGVKWEDRNPNLLPEGWTPGNIRRQLNRRAKLTKAVKALAHEGVAAARSHLPQVHRTRLGMRFMDLLQVDDVRCDFGVLDTDSGQVNDLWLLVVRDVATSMLLGFGMRPARARDDGTQEHLKARDVKQLLGWVFQTYGLPPYRMTINLENNTASLEQPVVDALIENIGADRIHFEFAKMIGGKSPVSFLEKAVGNSKSKAMLESLNRLQHMMTSHFPGQLGLNYSVRPAEFWARKKEAEQIWKQHRPDDRANLRYPFYTIPQARAALMEIFQIQNQRTDHRLEGFREFAEWFNGDSWQPQHTFNPGTAPARGANEPAPGEQSIIKWRTRQESPVERAAWLLRDCPPFTRLSPEIYTVLYEHTQRHCVIKESGQVHLTHEGTLLRFAPEPGHALRPGLKCLGYFNVDAPDYLTLTDGKGGLLGTWPRLDKVQHGDNAALAAAIRQSMTALGAAQARAAELLAPEAADLAAMRDHNAGFELVTDPRPAAPTDAAPITSPIAAGLARGPRLHRDQVKASAASDEDIDAALRNALR